MAQSLLLCLLSSTAAADVSPGQRSHDPLLLSTTPSQRIKPCSGYPGSPAPVSKGKRYTLQGDGCHIAMLPSVAIEK
ncbi:Oleate activated transcription factor 3 [Dissostichus eleginoides]|uniref:Oleate activated transcription factor 3 n=1 Tax=Dissostichus eleginoides TaxID=100907 RepID=A0AAD9CNT1_DISEL|nr:Oleate activated transcription factor 3 [Dissostichus eleginoides]